MSGKKNTCTPPLRMGMYVLLVDKHGAAIGNGIVLEKWKRGTTPAAWRVHFLGSLSMSPDDPSRRRLEKESGYFHADGEPLVIAGLLDAPTPITRAIIDLHRHPALTR